jgi:hypothetical protein
VDDGHVAEEWLPRPRRRRAGPRLLRERRRRLFVPVCPPTTPEVVARCVPLAVDEVIDLTTGLRLSLPAARLRLDGQFVTAIASSTRSACWRARGHVAARHRPSTSITVELSCWSDDVTEIRLRARSRRARRWGARRRRRYFDATHEAADGLLRHLITTSAVLWRPPPGLAGASGPSIV